MTRWLFGLARAGETCGFATTSTRAVPRCDCRRNWPCLASHMPSARALASVARNEPPLKARRRSKRSNFGSIDQCLLSLQTCGKLFSSKRQQFGWDAAN